MRHLRYHPVLASMLRNDQSPRANAAPWKASANELAILRHLHTAGPASRSSLAKVTGLTNAAISRITRRLVEHEILQEGREVGAEGKPGRRFVELDLSTNAYVAGIGVQAVSQWVELMSLKGKILERKTFDVEDLTNAGAVLAKCCEETDRLIASTRVGRRRVLGVGVGIAGIVDTSRGTVLHAENLGWTQVVVQTPIEQRLGLPVYVENLRNCMILGSHHLANMGGRRSAMMVIAGLGIGASLIVDGNHLISGAGFAAGQIGHTRVEGANQQCTCGRIGCLDTVASGRAILRHLGLQDPTIDPDESSGATKLFANLSQRAEYDNDVAEVFRQAGRALGDVLGTAVTLFDPDCIFLTGPLAENDHYFSCVQERMSWYRHGTSAQKPALRRVNAQDALVPARLAFNRFIVSNSGQ